MVQILNFILTCGGILLSSRLFYKLILLRYTLWARWGYGRAHPFLQQVLLGELPTSAGLVLTLLLGRKVLVRVCHLVCFLLQCLAAFARLEIFMGIDAWIWIYSSGCPGLLPPIFALEILHPLTIQQCLGLKLSLAGGEDKIRGRRHIRVGEKLLDYTPKALRGSDRTVMHQWLTEGHLPFRFTFCTHLFF